MDWDDINSIGRVVVGTITFIALYIFAIVRYGYLLGVGLGWLPAAIIAVIASFLWPVVVLGIVLILLSLVH